uniref:Uncharacterized protein n=1 Tax=Nelumbo nucifera TaxID=4432 RepID=A0A822Y6R2_NELNU|nr:TPA_asm: hypothetical protein HUJ06_026762 [Nelumbo nucifera]
MAINLTTILLIIIDIVFVLVLISGGGAEAARELPGDFAGANHLLTYPSVYEQANSALLCWLGRLSSGQSPGGPGH